MSYILLSSSFWSWEAEILVFVSPFILSSHPITCHNDSRILDPRVLLVAALRFDLKIMVYMGL